MTRINETDIQVSATDKVLGRASVGAGPAEEITMTAAGRALVDDADASAQRSTLGLGSGGIGGWLTSATSLGARYDFGFLNDDTATGVVVGISSGMVALLVGNSVAASNGLVFCRTLATVDAGIIVQAGGSTVAIVAGDGTLSGTTGPDGQLNIRMDSSNGGRIWIENRTGALRAYTMYLYPR